MSQTGSDASAGPQSAPRIIDKSEGEAEEIRMRDEWFNDYRRPGLTSDSEMSTRRYEAVLQTKQFLDAQRERQAAGFEGEQNVWAAMGPSPSTFGGWAFGNVSGRIQAIEVDWLNNILYVGATAGGAWKSENNGLTWTEMLGNVGTQAVGAIAVDPNDADVLWVGTGDNIVGCDDYFGIGLLRSADGGDTWELRNGTGGNTLQDLASFGSIMIDPRDSDNIVVGGRYRGCVNGNQFSGGIYTTADGGLNWTVRLSNRQVHEIARDRNSLDILWAATDAGVFRSTDNGVNWTGLAGTNGLPGGGFSRMELAIAPSNGNVVYALFDNGGDEFWRTTDGGATWSQMGGDACDGQCFYNMVLRVHSQNPDIVYRGTIRVFKTVDGGANWTVLTDTWGSGQQVHQDTQSMLVNPSNGNDVIIGTDGGVWRTLDGGNSFSNLNGNLNVTQFYAIGVDAMNPNQICGGAQDNSSLARNDSNVWQLQSVTGDGFVCHINPLDPDYAYIASYPSNGYPSIRKSTTGLFGSFFPTSGGSNGIIQGDRAGWVTPYILDPVNPETLYLGTHRIYKSTDHGSNWTQVGPGDITNSGSATVRALEVNRVFPDIVFSGASNGTTYWSQDGGINWLNITAGLPARGIGDIAGDPTNPNRAFAVVGGFNTPHLWEFNNGVGWIARGEADLPNVPHNSVLMLTDQDIMVGTDTGIFRSTDGGQTFVPYMVGMPQGTVVTDLKYNEQQALVTAGTYGRGAWQVQAGVLTPILLPEQVELPMLEIDGDGDDKMEPGETWGMKPILRNVGGVTAVDVTARLATSTPGITMVGQDEHGYGDLEPNIAAASDNHYLFKIDPAFNCSSAIEFDLVDIESPAPPNNFADRVQFFQTLVQGGNLPPQPFALLDDDLDPPTPSWTSDAVDPQLGGCTGVTYSDEWTILSKEAAYGDSLHCGSGPGGTYAKTNYAWLYLGGTDTQNIGTYLPPNTLGITLTIDHWYDTAVGQDGGQVLIDFLDDGQDAYVTLNPIGGYPGNNLDTGYCNGLEGQPAFQGSSGGWVTSTFDLTPYADRFVWIAFVFGSDRRSATGEGWYIDNVKLEFHVEGPPTCDITHWPGEVPSAHFSLTGPSTIEASWGQSCNILDFPEQTYSVQIGDLDSLFGAGNYTHAAAGGVCNEPTTATTFTPGSGNEYYLIVPNGEGRQGGSGADSSGNQRPQTDAVCGTERVATCP
jgi:hypothetical protein